MTRFWDSAMDIAAAAAYISRALKISVPDEAYTLGLFHNCGNILMLQKFPGFPAVLDESYSEHGCRIIDLENDELKTNHAVVGYYVAKAWKLPKHICQAVALHHSAKEIFADHQYDDDNLKTLLAILKMAEHICGIYRILGRQEIDYEWQEIESDVLGYLELNDSNFQSLVENIADLGLVDSRHINFAA